MSQGGGVTTLDRMVSMCCVNSVILLINPNPYNILDIKAALLIEQDNISRVQ